MIIKHALKKQKNILKHPEINSVSCSPPDTNSKTSSISQVPYENMSAMISPLSLSYLVCKLDSLNYIDFFLIIRVINTLALYLYHEIVFPQWPSSAQYWVLPSLPPLQLEITLCIFSVSICF